MFAHYLKSTFRNLSTNRFHTLINILGLALGLASFILIALFVRYELSYDSQFTKADRIYRISRDYFATSERTAARPAGMAGPAAALLQQDFPEVEQAARIFCCGAIVKTETGEPVLEGGYAMADNALFEIFNFEWLSGDPATALLEPYTIVLTRRAAERHFGSADPMGQLLQYGGGQNWQSARVTGVIENLPENSHLKFDFLESNVVWSDCRCDEQEQTNAYMENWENNVFYTYVLLAEGASITPLQQQAGEFFERHVAEGASLETGFTATPIRDIHLRGQRESELWLETDAGPAVGMATLYSFSAIAVFILLLACINFMNLATALSVRRGKEVGVRKVVGAGRHQLILQFMLESGLLVFVAAVSAVALVEFLLPSFSRFLVRELVFDYASDLNLLLWLALLVALTAVIAGSYPSLYLAALKPDMVPGFRVQGRGTALLRKLLVVFQFSISILLLICTLVVHAQLQHVRNLDPGFDRSGMLVLSPNNVGGEEWQTLKRQWLAHPNIDAVTSSSLVPFTNNVNSAALRAPQSGSSGGRMPYLQVDYGFFETYRIKLLAGRTFSESFGTDRLIPGENGELGTQPFILSEAAARAFGWTPEAALGREIEFTDVQGARFRIEEVKGPVVGVVADIHFESLHNSIEPLVYMLPGAAQSSVALKVRSADQAGTQAFIKDTFQGFRPGLPATVVSLDQRFAEAYLREERQGSVLTVFAGLAILIACLGLLGLAAHAAAMRTKEIGVRKVIGGSVWSIVLLLTHDFSKLVLAANLVAWPVAYFAMQRWLENFAYRIDITPLIFIGSGLIALCIAWVTVGGIAAKAAAQKPVLALRYE